MCKILKEGENLVVVVVHRQDGNVVCLVLNVVEPVGRAVVVQLLCEKFRAIEANAEHCCLFVGHLCIRTTVEEHYGRRLALPLGLAIHSEYRSCVRNHARIVEPLRQYGCRWRAVAYSILGLKYGDSTRA